MLLKESPHHWLHHGLKSDEVWKFYCVYTTRSGNSGHKSYFTISPIYTTFQNVCQCWCLSCSLNAFFLQMKEVR